MRLIATLLVIAAASLSVTQGATAQPFSQVIVFGDSNVDSGWFRQLSAPGGGTDYDADWPSAVAHGAGVPTTSPGLMVVQVLAAYFGLTANPANTAGGTNWATSGAKNVIANSTANGGFTAAIPTVLQFRNYLAAAGGTADPNALYVIWSGDNDVAYANGDLGTTPPPDPQGYVVEYAEDLAADIRNVLQANGAKHIVVAGLAYDFPMGNSTDATGHRALKLLYTQTLFQNLTQIGVSYIPANTDQVRLAIYNNPSNYGFTNIGTQPGQWACSEPTNGVTSSWALLCSSNPQAPSTWTGSTPQTDLFADDQHLATSGQRLMADYMFHLIVPPTVTHDFNTDGKSDILWRDTAGDVALWLMNGAAVSQSSIVGNAPTTWSIVGQRDFNGDGKSDILWHDTSGNVAVWLMSGSTVSQALGVGNAPTVWSIVGTGDFFGNGNGDILWHDTSGDVAIWELNGANVVQSCGVGSAPTKWSIAGTGDFNDDGMTDILWHDTSGDVAIWELNGCTVAQSLGVGTANPSVWSIAGTGDFNGDGMSDILWHDSSGDVAIWEMNGATVTQSLGVGAANPSAWSITQTGDYYETGKSDILWHDTSGDVAVWEMNGATVVQSAGVGTAPSVWSIQGAGAD